MKSATPSSPSGKITAGMVSIAGLLLVWGIVWANLPSRDELLSARTEEPVTGAAPAVPELDLSIPGLPSPTAQDGRRQEPAPAVESNGVWPDAGNGPARQIAEVKCEAEVQRFCPDSLPGDERRHCVERRMKHWAPICQQIVRHRIVRWKEAEGYKAACTEDVKRVCLAVEPGEGRILQCLQEHEQDISEACYRTLPKGRLLMRN